MANIRQYRYPFKLYHISIRLILVLALSTKYIIASQDILPDFCDSYRCPPYDDIICPEDSQIREIFSPADANYIDSITAVPSEDFYNTTQYAAELYTQCCLAKKCICKTCHIPSCQNENDVVVEITPESMEKPGHCCGQYECHPEPNCTEVRDTESWWLTDCKRCRCFSGKSICHERCDEGKKKTKAICQSTHLNQYFLHGQVWKYGCFECECSYGEEKCVVPFCKTPTCQTGWQPKSHENKCCPECVPTQDDYNTEEDGYDEDIDDPISGIPLSHDDLEPLPTIKIDSKEIKNGYNNENSAADKAETIIRKLSTTVKPIESSSSSTSSSTTSSTTETPLVQSSSSSPTIVFTKPAIPQIPFITDTYESNNPDNEDNDVKNDNDLTASGSTRFINPTILNEQIPPCKSDQRQVYPEVVEVVPNNSNIGLYIIMIFLLGFCIVMVVWNCKLRAKQRSYDPVSSFDDNCNKTLSNIKKTSDFV